MFLRESKSYGRVLITRDRVILPIGPRCCCSRRPQWFRIDASSSALANDVTTLVV
jgi:hypothetical protein